MMDLNLLQLFDLLYEVRSVSAAARRLNLTQSAISHSLARLREMIGDPLFTRGGSRLRPTARAEELGPQVRDALARIRGILQPPLFEPAETHRTFTIATGPYFSRLVVPQLIERALAVAPHVKFKVVDVDPNIMEFLDCGSVDVAIGRFADVSSQIKVRTIMRDDCVWVCSKGNELAETELDPSSLADLPSVLLSRGFPFQPPVGETRASPDGEGRRRTRGANVWVNTAGVRGRIAVTVYEAEAAAMIVGRTNMFGVLPRRFALARASEEGLHIFESPIEAAIESQMVWHERFHFEPGLTWLRNLIVGTTSQLEASE